MKKILAITFAATCLFLSSCQKNNVELPKEEVTYYNNMSVIGLAVNAEEDLSESVVFVDISAQVLQDACGMRLDLCDEYVVKKADNGRLDEYGILHCADGVTLDILSQSVNDYVLNRQNDSVTLSHYEDADTVRNGIVRVYGNYVVYTFLPNEENSVFQSCVESLLIE